MKRDLPPGRREANKREKLERIRRAARQVFQRKGFEAATVREIAAVADVAFGTLFLYAKDKQDLLLLLFDEELMALTERAFAQVGPEMSFVDQIMAFFGEFYDFFSATPRLSRDMMREVIFSGGIVAKRVRAGVLRTEAYLARIVAQEQANGGISSRLAPDLAADIIFNLYRAEIRRCLVDARPDVVGSLALLRQQIQVLLSGFASRDFEG